MYHTKWILLLFFIPAFFLLFFFHTRGFLPHDEGWIVNPAYRFLQGEIPYKDFHFIYFPGSLFLTAFLLSFFKTVLALRIAAVCISIISFFLMFQITYKVGKNIFLSILASSLFLVFGPFTINFASPTILAIPSSLATVYFVFTNFNTKKGAFLLAGMTSALTMLFKQNFGVAIVVTSIIGILTVLPDKGKVFKLYTLGFLLMWLPVLLFLFSTNGLTAFFADTYYFTIEKTMQMGLQVTPFFYADGSIYTILKTLFYISPLMLSVTGLLLAYKHKKQFLPFPLFTLLFYLFGIRPTTDYVHLAPLIALIGIPLTVIFSLSHTKKAKIVSLTLSCLFLFIGLYTILFLHYYRWEEPILKHNTFSNHNRVHIFVNKKADDSIQEVQTIIDNNKKEGDYVFIYDYAPLYYFLTDTKNPTKFDFFPPLTADENQEIIDDLQSKHVSLILTTAKLKNDTSPLGKFIMSNYVAEKIHHFFVWKRN